MPPVLIVDRDVQIAQGWISSTASERFIRVHTRCERAAGSEKKKCHSRPAYLKRHMRLFHFPISMNLI